MTKAPPPASPSAAAPGERRDASARFDRRELMRLACTSAAAAGSVGLGVFLLDRKASAKAAAVIRDHRVERAAGAAHMAVCKGNDPAANVRRAVEALGGMAAFVRRGDKVVVKPNAGWNRLPEQAANTNPDVVAEVVRMALAAGASKVWVADVPVNNAERCLERSGIRKAAGAAGATVVMPDLPSFRTVEVGGKLLREGEVLWPFVEADKVVNVAIVKQHGLSRATMTMKNWYGVLGGHRVRLHQDIHRSIVELAAMMKPTLSVLDATRILIANGPTGGSLDDVKRLDVVAAGVDEVALDAWGAELLGLAPEDVRFVVEGERAGLGKADYKSLKVVQVTG